MMDDFVFIKHNLRAPYYVMQESFPAGEYQEKLLTAPDGSQHAIYTTTQEHNGYMSFPTTTGALGELEMLGNEIRDGFRILK